MPYYNEYKRRYDPEEGKFIYRHIHGEGLFDTLKSVGRRFARKTAKRAANTAVKQVTARSAAAEKQTVKAADGGTKIVELLRKKSPQTPAAQLTTEQRIRRLLEGGSGGGLILGKNSPLNGIPILGDIF